MKRSKPLRRRGRVEPVNRERRDETFARNYGAEADALRLLPCVVASHGNGRHRCSGRIEVAHVVARGMGGAKGGRFDIVPMCSKAHRNAGEFSVKPDSMRFAFETLFGVDLRAEADRLAVGHERPLGVRGLADRWVEAQIGSGSLSEVLDWQLDAYETEFLRGWVTRELAREVAWRTERWGGRTSDELLARGYAAHDDRGALAHHIGSLLGGDFAEDPHGEHGLAWSLCEWATEGRWVS